MSPDPSSAHWFNGSVFSLVALAAAFGFARGVIKQALWVGGVGAGAFVAYWCHSKLSALGWHSGGPLYLACGVPAYAAYWATRKIAGLLTFLEAIELTGMTGAVGSIIPSGGLIWLAGIAMRWAGSSDHLAETAKVAKTHLAESTVASSVWSQGIHALDDTMVGRLIASFDPVTPDANMKLAKLLVLTENPHLLREMHQNSAFDKVLGSPKIKALTEHERIKLLIEHEDFEALLYDPDVNAAVADKELSASVTALDLEKITSRRS
jgi:hypothetical protein